MNLTSTYLKKFIVRLRKQKRVITLVGCFICVFKADARILDTSKNNQPVVITELEQCKIPTSMILRIKHLTPSQMKVLNEEYQQTDLSENGQEIVSTVKLRFIDDHITGYIKQSLINSSEQTQHISYIDIPVEWMCIPPKQDHPFHFSSSIAELDSIKEENGCLDWVQRDNQVLINFAKEKPRKKGRSSRNASKSN